MTVYEFLSVLGLIILFIVFFYIVYLTTTFIGKINKNYNINKNIKIIEKVPISNNMFLLLIELDNKNYLISVSKDSISLIDKIDDLTLIDSNKKNVDEKFNNILLSKIRKTINNKEK
ncbi:flagellar biosynthetic protein FliO [Clostridiaceae bacterium HSG29]|nr:flagellar biosynthetic protein FliO [Clostridiaceae bacterium HSG29]